MLSVINESSTRIKTGIVLLIAMLVIGYIDSYFVFWLVFGIMLLISISEAKKLFGIKNDAIFVYTTLLWIAAYFYPKPEDLICLCFTASIQKNTEYKCIFATFISYSFIFIFIVII